MNIDPEAYGTASGYIGHNFISYNPADGSTITKAFPSGGIGSVAAGWEPGDPYTCVAKDSGATSNLCSGTPFEEVDNTPISGGNSLTSVATRLWCTHGSVAHPIQSQIMDWGQLTNLTGSEVPGQGAPIGVPIRITAVNQGSGTLNGFMNFADGGNGSTNCARQGDLRRQRRPGDRTRSPRRVSAATHEIALENNAAQVGDFANANWGASDAADQAVDIATSLYFISFGVYKTSPWRRGQHRDQPRRDPDGPPGSLHGVILASNGTTSTRLQPGQRTTPSPGRCSTSSQRPPSRRRRAGS